MGCNEKGVAAEKPGLIYEPREEQVMFKRNFVITVLVVVGLSIAAVVSAGMYAQRKGMSCMGDMMGMGGMEGGKGMQGMGAMAGMDKEEMAQQPATAEKKKVGEEFTCPVDGMRMKV